MIGEDKTMLPYIGKSLYQIDYMREALDATGYKNYECCYSHRRLGYIHAYLFEYEEGLLWL